MKLEYLDDITDNGKYPYADPTKLIRLYDFDQNEAACLKRLIESKLLSDRVEVDISNEDFVETQNCTLKFQLASEDYGIDLPSDNRSFVCKLRMETYQTMTAIISGFTAPNDGNGYNWLYDPKADKIDLLFSPGGTW